MTCILREITLELVTFCCFDLSAVCDWFESGNSNRYSNRTTSWPNVLWYMINISSRRIMWVSKFHVARVGVSSHVGRDKSCSDQREDIGIDNSGAPVRNEFSQSSRSRSF